MKLGTLYGIGVGPGDPELLTVKAANILARCPHVFVPKARVKTESVALEIARRFVSQTATVRELVFPMTRDTVELAQHWAEATRQVAAVLEQGEDVCFLTLGDALLYSTYIYLLRELKRILPAAQVVTVPGVTSFAAAAALTNFPIGEGKEAVTIVPTADDLTAVRRALAVGGTVVLMKIGERLAEILELLEQDGLLEESVFVARAGLEGQRIETDLRQLKAAKAEAGYLSVVLVHAGARSKE
jgi:precorrin-2/cobalt-factor-2 C20-methyltransferase